MIILFEKFSNQIFPNSKVKKIVYRSGDLISKKKSGGFWFGESEEDIKNFIQSYNWRYKPNSYYINIENPKYYDSFWDGYLDELETKFKNNRDKLMQHLISKGYDGIIIKSDTWSGGGIGINDLITENPITSEQYVVFDVNNIHLIKN